jgi:hypothetical protein
MADGAGGFRGCTIIDRFGMSVFLSLRLRKTLAWLALCAMCFGGVAPTVSRWLAAQAVDLVAVCDAQGVTLIPASQLQALAREQGQRPSHGGSPVSHHPSGDEGDSCSYCTLQHHSPGVPTAAAGFALHAPLLAAHTINADVPVPSLRAVRRPQMPQAPPRALV